MPFAILPLVLNLLKSKVTWYVLSAIAAAIALSVAVHHLESVGAHRELAKLQGAWDSRIKQADGFGVQAAARIQTLEVENARKQAKIAELSKRNDGKPCLDSDAVDRLRGLSTPHK